MEATDVLDVLAVLAEDDLPVVIEGGWGIDALLGAQHRTHDDLDLVIAADKLDTALETLSGVGFEVAIDLRPRRVMVADRSGRRVDLYVVRIDENGELWQDGGAPDGTDIHYAEAQFITGWVGGQAVRCIDAQMQVARHAGYEPVVKDRHDLELLQKQFGVSLPVGYW